MRTLLLAGCWVVLGAGSLQAQRGRWSVSLEAGEMRLTGTSADTSLGGDGALRPFRPSTFGLRLGRGAGSLRMELGIVHGSADAALEGREATLVSRGSRLTLLEFAPAVLWRVWGGRGGSGGVYLVGGPIVDRWTWAAGEPRTRIGATAGVLIEAPIGASVTALFRIGAGLTGSVFSAAELPAAFARRASWRRNISVGVRLGR